MNKNSVNKVILVGRLGKDPEVRYTPNGDAVADLSLATTESFKNKSGEYTDRTEWHSCIVWRNQAEFAKNYLKKGTLVYVEGRLQTRSWEDQQGVKKYKTEVVVSTLTSLSRPEGQSQGSRGQQGAPNQQGASKPQDDGDIPF